MEEKAEIKLIDVYKTYQMGEVEVPVLRGIDLELYNDQLTVIHGDSGAGKSTLLNLIGGINRPTKSAILFGGKDIAQLTDQELTLYRRRSVGFVFQFYNPVATLTARENVEVSTEIADDPMDPAEALKHVRFEDRMEHFPAQMSGGQQQVSVKVAFDRDDLEKLQASGRKIGVEYRVWVRIVTDSKEGALIVPRTALIRGDEGDWQVFAVKDGKAELTGMGVGLSNDRQAEISSGLKEGEVVVIAPPSTLTGGTRISYERLEKNGE